MIHYQLRCTRDHAFDGWFKDSASFDKQAKRGLVECPTCGDTKVERALMAPAVATSKAAAPPEPVQAPPAATPPPMPAMAGGRMPAQLMAMLQKLRAFAPPAMFDATLAAVEPHLRDREWMELVEGLAAA